MAQKALQQRRATLKSETSLHVYSIQPAQPKATWPPLSWYLASLAGRYTKTREYDHVRFASLMHLSIQGPGTVTRAEQLQSHCTLPQDRAELYNNDLEQSRQLFDALYRQHTANCLSDNRFSAISCTAAKWDPSLSSLRKAPPAAPPHSTASAQSQGQRAAVKEAIDSIVSSALVLAPSHPTSGGQPDSGSCNPFSSSVLGVARSVCLACVDLADCPSIMVVGRQGAASQDGGGSLCGGGR